MAIAYQGRKRESNSPIIKLLNMDLLNRTDWYKNGADNELLTKNNELLKELVEQLKILNRREQVQVVPDKEGVEEDPTGTVSKNGVDEIPCRRGFERVSTYYGPLFCECPKLRSRRGTIHRYVPAP